jgi:hypothetical protein
LWRALGKLKCLESKSKILVRPELVEGHRKTNVVNIWGTLFAAPITIIALAPVVIIRASGGHVHIINGVIEASEGAAPVLLKLVSWFGRVDAITLGHVILARDRACANALRTHEHTHVRQYERWGFFFPLLYIGSSAIALLRGGDLYRDNVFEIEAHAAEDQERRERAQQK